VARYAGLTGSPGESGLKSREERLHEEITADYNDMIYAATREESRRAARPSSANGGSSIAPSPTACRKPGIASSPSRACRQAGGRARAPTPSRAARGVQAADQDADGVAIGRHRSDVVLGLLASGQINMRKVDGWQTLATRPIDQPN
jgi:hypothetical protein